MSADRYFQRIWYGPVRFATLCLLPLSWLFGLAVVIRRGAYRIGLLRSEAVGCPVIVVGNITVGGTGKTPFTMWLAERLAVRGLKVGVILRGYSGSSSQWPQQVTAQSDWERVGDEAVMIAARSAAIVVAGPDRVEDARQAIALGAQVIVSDDGLQHYRLRRDAEILVCDEQRALGNGFMLPAGPLREGSNRMTSVDLCVMTRRGLSPASLRWPRSAPSVAANMTITGAVHIVSGRSTALAHLAGRTVHAIAAIGHPEPFFAALRECGLAVREHAYPDHAPLAHRDVVFDDDLPVLMTEKDAVKCRRFADERHWVVPVHIELGDDDRAAVDALLDRLVVLSR